MCYIQAQNKQLIISLLWSLGLHKQKTVDVVAADADAAWCSPWQLGAVVVQQDGAEEQCKVSCLK